MKKLLALILSATMVLSFAACSSNQQGSSQSTTQATKATEEKLSVETDKFEWADYAEYKLDNDVPVKNVILMIGDGMGENTIKSAEIVKGDKLVVSGMKNKTYVTTYSQSVTEGDAEYTDSAASATALSSGVKTYNSYLNTDPKDNKLESICEYAMKYDMKTGLVARQYICHATPAGMIAHNDCRDNYSQIMKEMAGSGVNVMFGGGSQYITDSKKVQKAIKSNNYKYIDDEKSLLNLKSTDDKVIGAFAYGNMSHAQQEPSLTTMTAKSLDILNNDNGFFLMVEGSNIDTFAHQSDMKSVMEETEGFDHTVNYVLKWAENNPGTLVIVTADHETGGIKIPKNATAKDINDSCFTSNGKHTNTNVLLMAEGAKSKELCKDKLIDNTDVSKYMRKVIADNHKKTK